MSAVPQTSKILSKANGSFALLRNIFKKKYLSTKAKLICYKQLIRPILTYAFAGWCFISSHQMCRIRSFERKILYKCLPVSEAYIKNSTGDYFKLIPRSVLYSKFPKLLRIDQTIFSSFIKFIERFEYSDIEFLKNIVDPNYLLGRYLIINEKFLYKAFPPSFLYKLYKENRTHDVGGNLKFYNRPYNSNNLDEYVYDLANPI